MQGARPRGILGGAILIAVGAVYLLQALGFAHSGAALFIGLGAAFAAAYHLGARQYVYLVPAAVLVGFGLGLLVPSAMGLAGTAAALVFFAFLGAGLVMVFLLAPERRWPLVPAAFVGVLALLAWSGRADIIPPQAQAYLIPLILIAVGGYLLVEQRGH